MSHKLRTPLNGVVEYTDFSLCRTIKEVVTTQISCLYEKRLTLQRDLPSDLPDLLRGYQLTAYS